MMRAAVLVSVLILAACHRDVRSPEISSPAAADGSPCAKNLAELRAFHDSLPRDLANPGVDVEEVARRVAHAREVAEWTLPHCAGRREQPEVEYLLAYLTFISFDRRVNAGEAKGLELADRALALCASALAAVPAGSQRAAELLSLQGYLLRKRAAYQRDDAARRRDLSALRESFARLLAARPDWPERGYVEVHIAEALLGEGEYAKARQHAERLLADPARLQRFSLEEKLHDALNGLGELEAMEALVRKRLAEYPLRMERKDLPQRERDLLEVWLDIGEFWLGHIRLAMGDPGRAHEALQAHVERLDQKEVALEAQGLSISGAARTVRDFRSRDLLRFLEKDLGKIPERDLDLGELWCGPDRTTLAGSRGKVVAILFRNPHDRRSAPFLAGLDAFWRRERSRGLEAAVVGHVVGDAPPAEQVRALAAELAALKVDIPGGVVDRKESSGSELALFEAFGTFAGSPTFVAVDRAGRLAWYLPDPRGMDLAIAERVLRRLLDEAPPTAP